MTEVDRLKLRQATLDVIRFLDRDALDITGDKYSTSFDMLLASYTPKQLKTGRLV